MREHAPLSATVRLELSIIAIMGLLLGLVSCQSHRPAEVALNPPYAEPVVLSGKDGVLDVTLNAHQDSIALNTVSQPVANALVYGYRVNHGQASDGRRQNASNYPGPTLHVQPGDRLVIRMENNLRGLTIPDFLDPMTVPAGQPIPAYPARGESAPINLHTHGLHVSPKGNADNVLLDIPAGGANVYEYRIPADHPQGLYWYHPHRHMETDGQVDSGLAGMLIVGRADGNLPLVTENSLPVRTMALQNNFVFNRQGGGHALNRADWPQYVSTLVPPRGDELSDGTYRPSLAPVNFTDSPVGTTFATSWFAGPLTPKDKRGNLQIVPQNLQTFTSATDPSANQLVNRSLPDAQRDVQFTVNGQFQPSIAARPGQTEIWVLANITAHAFMNVAVRETATGKLTQLRVVGVDGDPMTAVHVPPSNGGTTLLIPPAQRYAIAVTMPARGGLQLEMPPVQGVEAGYTQPISLPGIKYTANGTDHPAAVLGTISMDLSDISWNDGFLTFPTQKMLSMDPVEGTATPVAFEPGQKLGGSGEFVDTATMPVAVERKFTITGAFNNKQANDQYKRSFFYNFNDYTWPNGPLVQPRLGTVEEWEFISAHHDQHPTHIHVNDFQVMKTVNPVQGITTGVQDWAQDTFQIPGLLPDPANPDGYGGNTFGKQTLNGAATVRTRFDDFTGTYVMHCHRLNHEDNGLMMTVNVLPATTIYAVAQQSGAAGAVVTVFDQQGDREIARIPVTDLGPAPSIAVGDVDGDQVSDVVLGASSGFQPWVVAYSGAASEGKRAFSSQLARFLAGPEDFRGGVNVTVAGVDGNPMASNIVAAQGPGGDGNVTIYASELPESGQTPATYSSFQPYPGGSSGVVLAAGLVDAMSGRVSIITAPGEGVAAWIKTFRNSLFHRASQQGNRSQHTGHKGVTLAGGDPVRSWNRPDGTDPIWDETSSFVAFGGDYLGGVNLSAGWLAGELGGAQRIVVRAKETGEVIVYSSGSGLDGQPAAYAESPTMHDATVTFAPMAQFNPGPGAGVGTASTSVGADLLITQGSGTSGSLVRYRLTRPAPDATTLKPERIATVELPGGAVSLAGS